MRTRDLLTLIRKLEKAEQKVNALGEKYSKRIRKELNSIANSVISDWYDSYDRRIYDPYGSLYHAYSIKVTDNNYSVTFSPKYMKHIRHNQDNQIIYNNSFLRGYHGGSIPHNQKDPVSSAIVPWWRGPMPYYTQWQEPAVKSFSPYWTMYEKMNDAIDVVKKDAKKEYDDIVNPIMDFVKKRI